MGLLPGVNYFPLLLLFGYPFLHGLFYGPGEVALLPVEPLDSLEPELPLKLIRELYADSTHLSYHLTLIHPARAKRFSSKQSG